MKNIITFLGVLMLLGCSSTNISQYQNTTPKINVKEFFNGKIEGHGFFQNRFTGKIEKRYYVEMTGSWNGNDGTLSEVFYLDDNTTMKRQWHLKSTDENNFTGTASDIIGTAKGQTQGFALQLNYTLAFDRGNNKTINLNFDDWIYLMQDGSAINRSVMSKFGIRLGEIIFNFRKLKSGEDFKHKFN